MKKLLPLIAIRPAIASFVLSAFLVAPNVSTATEIGQCSHTGHLLSKSLMLPEVHERRPYDVLSYDLTLDWRTPFTERKSVYSGVQVMKIKITEPTDVIAIDASLIRMDSAWVNGERFDIAPNGVNDLFRFTFSTELKTGDELTIKMAFTRYMAAEVGAYFYPKGHFVGRGPIGDSVFVEEDLIYTQSEPLDAQYWMPCMNLPYDKADSRINIRVPAGMIGISNGILDSIFTHKDGSHTFYWRSDKPLASYLMVANASKYVEWDEKYARPSNPSDSVRAIYYAWQADYDGTSTDGSGYNAKRAFAPTTRILREFSTRFGEYPFAQYGQVPVQPYKFGGMEHQGMTTVNRSWLRGFSESGIAHEIGHQWFGDKVTCETWDDLWLNEGFASYTEAIWAEINGGTPAYFNVIQDAASNYFQRGLQTASIFGPPALQAFDAQYAPLIYSKASAVIHSLRRYINNDTLFFNAIRDYTDNFAYGHVTTAKFEQYMSARLGMDLTQFFAQWIYGAGTPDYTIKWDQSGNALNLMIEQIQDVDVFQSPLRFFVFNYDGSIDTVIVQNTERVQYYKLPAGKEITGVDLDMDWAVLSMHDINHEAFSSVAQNAAPSTSFTVRNDKLTVSNVSALTGVVQIVDVLGRAWISSELVSQQSSTIDISSLPAGSYFVTLDSEGTRETYRFQR